MNFFRFHRRVQPQTSTRVALIVGLGNPGRAYRSNRHNVGFLLVDQLCAKMNVRLSRMQSKSLIGSGQLGETKVILAKPQTFMNNSGQAVAALVRYYKIGLDQLLVVHDDLDLPLGTLRIRPGGGPGGQKGLASAIEELGTQEFPRLRIGIGRPPGRMDAAAYVLQDFSPGEQQLLDLVLQRAVEAAQVFLTDGLEQAMNRFNGIVKDE
ncbi:MAG: aminoacyl-tRNA hydrolase [Anaerolineaceae bacterium]